MTERVEKTAEWWVENATDLPDSSFAYIEPGGVIDEVGKTAPRILRHLPYKDADGAPDKAQLEKCIENLQSTGLAKATQKRIAKRLQAEKDVHWPVDDSRFRGSSLTDAGEKAPNQKRLDLEEEAKAKQPGSRIQTLIFDKEKYPKAEDAKAWANDHGFTDEKVDETGESFRLRQEDPTDYARMRTMALTEGVSAVVGFPKKHIKAVQKAFDGEIVKKRLLGTTMKYTDRDAATFDVVDETPSGVVYSVKSVAGTWHYAVGGEPAVAVPLANYSLWKRLAKAAYTVIWKAEGDDAEEKRYTLGVVYPASEAKAPSTDFHGDFMTTEELQKAAWGAMKEDGVGVGLMHRPGTKGAGRMVESYIWPAGAPEWKVKDVTGQEQTIRPGDWLGGVVWTPDAWSAIKSGNLTGYSLQGIARHSSD